MESIVPNYGSNSEKSTDTSVSAGFTVTVRTALPGAQRVTDVYRCGRVVIATGFEAPNAPATIDGVEHAQQYADLPETGEHFEGKSVAVFGLGNSAMETADALSPHANFVHQFPGRAAERRNARQFVSWESRYVGSVRALNAGPLDAYLLKSLDGGFQNGDSADKMVIRLCGEDDACTKDSKEFCRKRCLFRRAGLPPPNSHLVILGSHNLADTKGRALLESINVTVLIPNATHLAGPFTRYGLTGVIATATVDWRQPLRSDLQSAGIGISLRRMDIH